MKLCASNKNVRAILCLALTALSTQLATGATITGLSVAPNGTPLTVPTNITYEQGSVSAFTPIVNKGSISLSPYESKWSPDKLTFYYSTNSSGGHFNSSSDWGKTTYSNFGAGGTRAAAFGFQSPFSGGQEGVSMSYSPYTQSLAAPTQQAQMLSGLTSMEKRFNQGAPTSTSYVRSETDVAYSTGAGTIEVNGQVGSATSTAVYLNQSPTFLWSGSYNLNGSGVIRDFPVIKAGGSDHRMVVYKRPADYAAAGTAPVESIVLDPSAGQIRINSVPVAMANAVPALNGPATFSSMAIGGSMGSNTTLNVGTNTVLYTGAPTAPMYALAVGTSNVISGEQSVAFGMGNNVSTPYGAAIGLFNTVTDEASFAAGMNSDATSIASVALGDGALADEWGMVAVGEYNLATSPGADKRLFVVGNGTGAGRSDAFSVQKNGNVNVQSTAILNYGGANAQANTLVVKANDIAGAAQPNALRITSSGKVLVRQQGDISMGMYGGGEAP